MEKAKRENLHAQVIEYGVTLSQIAKVAGYSKSWVHKNLAYRDTPNEQIIKAALSLVKQRKEQREEIEAEMSSVLS